MVMKRFFLLMVLLLGSLPLVQAADGAQQLERFLQGLTTLRAEFRQTVERPDDEGLYFSNGTFYLKRPGQLRWEYAGPYGQLIVADGSRIWLHDVELDQVSHRSQKAALEGTPAQLLSDPGPVTQHFEISEMPVADDLFWLELRPKDKDAQFSSVRLALVDNELRRMEMTDNFGQITRFVFSNVQRNPALNDELFIFRPPSGIDLIGDL